MDRETSIHIPVLLDEVLAHLQTRSGGLFVDATFGGGGHTKRILDEVPSNKVIGIDQDPAAIHRGQELVKQYGPDRLMLVQTTFDRLGDIATEFGYDQVDGVLFDLGLSSDLLADQERGFSFRSEGKLDMRFAEEGEVVAMDIVNLLEEEDLISIFKTFGEESKAHVIARAICKQRIEQVFQTSKQLGDFIAGTIGWSKKGRHPATKVFQALRIVVNKEFEQLQEALQAAIYRLRSGGRIVVLSYHSLEDRVVKTVFKQMSGKCVCFSPPDLCRCNKQSKLNIITKQPIIPNKAEISSNIRARSAKMRVAEKK